MIMLSSSSLLRFVSPERALGSSPPLPPPATKNTRTQHTHTHTHTPTLMLRSIFISIYRLSIYLSVCMYVYAYVCSRTWILRRRTVLVPPPRHPASYSGRREGNVNDPPSSFFFLNHICIYVYMYVYELIDGWIYGWMDGWGGGWREQ